MYETLAAISGVMTKLVRFAYLLGIHRGIDPFHCRFEEVVIKAVEDMVNAEFAEYDINEKAWCEMRDIFLESCKGEK